MASQEREVETYRESDQSQILRIQSLRSEILKPRMTSQQTKKRIPLEKIFFGENLTFRINGRPSKFFAPFGSKNL